MYIPNNTVPLQGEEQSDSVWEELFLIKVNVGVLEEIFNQLSSTELVALKVCSLLVALKVCSLFF